jgi:hypothetical protein
MIIRLLRYKFINLKYDKSERFAYWQWKSLIGVGSEEKQIFNMFVKGHLFNFIYVNCT